MDEQTLHTPPLLIRSNNQDAPTLRRSSIGGAVTVAYHVGWRLDHLFTLSIFPMCQQ